MLADELEELEDELDELELSDIFKAKEATLMRELIDYWSSETKLKHIAIYRTMYEL